MRKRGMLFSSKKRVSLSSHEDRKRETFPVTHVNVRVSIVLMLLKLILLDIFTTLVALGFFGTLSFAQLPTEARLVVVSQYISYFVILALVKIALTLFVVLQWINEYYEITPTKIIYRRGIIWRKEDIYGLSRINAIGIQQGIFGRIFNYGTLFIYDVGVFKYYYLDYIHNPLRYLDVLHNLLPNADIEKEIIREHIRDIGVE